MALLVASFMHIKSIGQVMDLSMHRFAKYQTPPNAVDLL